MAPNFSVTGFQLVWVRKLKPNVRKAGHEPWISETMIPPRMTRTVTRRRALDDGTPRRPTAAAGEPWLDRPARRPTWFRPATQRQPRVASRRVAFGPPYGSSASRRATQAAP